MSKSGRVKRTRGGTPPLHRNADNLVRCLTIEFEIELGLGSTVVPVGKKSELAPPQAPLCERGPSDGDAHARRLPGDLAFFLPSREGQEGWKEISVDRLFAAKIVTSGESQGRLAHYLRS
jgi:hypothetical protein